MPQSERPVALFAMSAENFPHVYPADVVARLRARVEVDPGLIVEDFRDARVRERLAETEILLTGWGCPHIGADQVAAAPRLRAVLHAAGSVKSLISQACWDRGVVVSSAASVNALPVAEYTLSMILAAGKDLLGQRERYRARRTFPSGEIVQGIGNHRRRVGVVGASRIGRRVIELLRPFDLEVALADPYVDAPGAAALGVRLLPLDELAATSDILTLHAPETTETRHLISARRLALMPDGATLINTARGALVDHGALIEELRSGRLRAVLDVSDPEPLPAQSPLYDLPGAFLTPHIAGSQGNEVVRLGVTVADELDRLIAGLPLAHAVDHSQLERAA